MPVPSTIDDLSTTASSNSPAGTDTPQDGDNYIRALSSFIAQLRDKLNGTTDPSAVTLDSPVLNSPDINGTATVEVMSVSGLLTAEDLSVNTTATVSTLIVLGSATIDADLQVSDDLTVTDDVVINGDLTAGSDANDVFTLNATPAGKLISNTYTPTLTALANVSASTSQICHYLRVGINVHVAGYINVDPTSANTATQIRISLPISSILTSQTDVAGVAAREIVGAATAPIAGYVIADEAPDNAAILLFVTDSDVASRRWYFQFMYEVK